MTFRARAWAALLGVVLAACGSDGMSGPPDQEIQSALPMEVNGLLDDRVDANEDPVDWKFFQFDVTDNFFLLVFFDNPEVKAEITIYTGAGNRVASIMHDPQNEFDLLQVPDLREGRYYVSVEIADGASVYTMRSATGSMPMLADGGGNTEPRPE